MRQLSTEFTIKIICTTTAPQIWFCSLRTQNILWTNKSGFTMNLPVVILKTFQEWLIQELYGASGFLIVPLQSWTQPDRQL